MKQGEVEKIMQEVISYVENLAYGRSENKECAILTGTHKHTYKGHFINHFQTSLVWFWANDGEWRLQRGLLGEKHCLNLKQSNHSYMLLREVLKSSISKRYILK